MNFARKEPLGLKAPRPRNGTIAGAAHMMRVKALRCVICHKPPPSEAHHCRSGGMARDDFKTLPLCIACHRGPAGYHSRKKSWEAENGPDHSYLAVVADMLAGELS